MSGATKMTAEGRQLIGTATLAKLDGRTSKGTHTQACSKVETLDLFASTRWVVSMRMSILPPSR